MARSFILSEVSWQGNPPAFTMNVLLNGSVYATVHGTSEDECRQRAVDIIVSAGSRAWVPITDNAPCYDGNLWVVGYAGTTCRGEWHTFLAFWEPVLGRWCMKGTMAELAPTHYDPVKPLQQSP